jgi:isocitrate dehydrogenase (NAD+)
MKLDHHATEIEEAVLKTIAQGKYLTGDLGGKASNTQFTDAVIQNLA